MNSIKIFLSCWSLIGSSNLLASVDYSSIGGDVYKVATTPVTPSFAGNPINLNDLSQSSTTMYNIRASGRYYIAGDLKIDATSNDSTIIKVTASNVMLNLNTAMIYQNISDAATGLIGVEVAANLSNVVIRNGTINGNTTNMVNGIKVNSGANNIVIENVNVLGCYTAGTEVSGLLLNTCSDVQVRDSEFNLNKSAATYAVNGIKLIDCTKCILENCTAVGNYGAGGASGATVYGIRLESSSGGCKYNRIVNCQATNNYTSGTDTNSNTIGFYANNGQSNIFDNCTSLGNQGTATAISAYGAGFKFDGTEKYSSIMNSAIIGNGCAVANTSGVAYGIWIPSTVTYCEIRNNRILGNSANLTAYGIYDPAALLIVNLYVSNFAHGNINNAGTITNFGMTVSFSSSKLVATYNVLTTLASAVSSYYNIDVTA